MPQSLHQRAAIQAVIRRRMRGLPSSALATVPPPSSKPAEGAGSSSPAPSAVPFFAHLAALALGLLTWTLIAYSLTADLWVAR